MKGFTQTAVNSLLFFLEPLLLEMRQHAIYGTPDGIPNAALRLIRNELVVHRILLLFVQVIDEDSRRNGNYIAEEHQAKGYATETILRSEYSCCGC